MKKRIFALLLALVMALGLAVTTAAEEPTNLNEWYTAQTVTDPAVEVVFGYGVTNEEFSVPVTGYDLGDGSYKLTGDLTITAPLIVTGTVTLDLNGHELKYENSTAQNSVIVVKDSASFTLTDSGSGGKITGGTGTRYEYIDKEPEYSYTRVFGGGVFVGSKAIFTMTGGSIEDCSATGGTYSYGGGVYLANALSADSRTTFNMTGSSIKNCHSGTGGGVCVQKATPGSP